MLYNYILSVGEPYLLSYRRLPEPMFRVRVLIQLVRTSEAMTRRSIPAKALDQRTFAVRVRFAIPENGLQCLNELHEWLRVRAPKEHAIHSTTVDSRHCAYLHLNDPALASECVQTFGLEVVGLPKESP